MYDFYRSIWFTAANLGFFHAYQADSQTWSESVNTGQGLFQNGYMRLFAACRLTNVMLQLRDTWCYMS